MPQVTRDRGDRAAVASQSGARGAPMSSSRVANVSALPWFPLTTATLAPSQFWSLAVAQALCGSRALHPQSGRPPTAAWAQGGIPSFHWRHFFVVLLEPIKCPINVVQRCLRGGKSKGAARPTYSPDLAAARRLGPVGRHSRERPPGGASACLLGSRRGLWLWARCCRRYQENILIPLHITLPPPPKLDRTKDTYRPHAWVADAKGHCELRAGTQTSDFDV